MPKPRAKEKIPDLENLILTGQKKFIRYDIGEELYSVSDKTLRDWVKSSGSEYKIGRMVLINVNILDEWLENFRVKKED